MTGSDLLTISVSDNGNHGSGGVKTTTSTFVIIVNNVNTAPVITVHEKTIHINEDTPLTVTAGLEGEMFHNGLHKLTLTSTVGGIYVSDPMVKLVNSKNGDSSLQLLGSYAAVQSLLEKGFTYVPVENGNLKTFGLVQITIELSDEVVGNIKVGSETINIIVEPVNDSPQFSETSTNLEMLEDETLTINFIIKDEDLNESEDETVSLKITSINGVIYFSSGTTFPGLLVVSNITEGIYNDLTILVDINTLNTIFTSNNVKYKPTENFNGDVKIKFSFDDLGNGGGESLTSEIEFDVEVKPVNDKPIIQLFETMLDCTEDTPLPFSGTITIEDKDFDDPGIHEQAKVTVSISCDVGTISHTYTSNNVIYEIGGVNVKSEVVVFSSLIVEVNKLIESMVYYPKDDWNSEDQAQVSCMSAPPPPPPHPHQFLTRSVVRLATR